MENFSNYIPHMLIAIIIIVIMILLFAIAILLNIGKGDDTTLKISKEIGDLERNVIKDSNDNFVKILNQNRDNSLILTKQMQDSLDKIRDANEKKLNLIESKINDKLDKSLNERLDSSFKTIGEQLQTLQVTNGKLLNMSGTITDLQKSLSNVKERGIFGEKQLENILSSIMVKGMYESQYKIKSDSPELVDFVIKIPNKDDNGFVLLPIDSKFPNDKYLAIVNASNEHNDALLEAAIKELKIAIMEQAKSISEKYIEPPITTDFAVMFLPTEGLYAEVLRIPNLAEECQTKHKILIAGPTTITAMINSFSVGFKFLMINKNSKEIAKTLQAIKTQFIRFGEEIDKTKKNLNLATESAEKLEKRNNLITNRLKSFEAIGSEESDQVLGIE